MDHEGTRILVVDDHALVREAISRTLSKEGFDVITEPASNGEEAIAIAASSRPQVILMDVSMPVMDGLEATHAIKERFPDIEVIILTFHSDEEFVVRAILNGASGFLLKNVEVNKLVDDVKAVLRGDNILDPTVTRAILKAVRGEKVDILSERERDILKMTSEGLLAKEIAGKLGLSVHTIKAHFQRIFQKMNASDKAHAVSLAIRRGLI